MCGGYFECSGGCAQPEVLGREEMKPPQLVATHAQRVLARRCRYGVTLGNGLSLGAGASRVRLGGGVSKAPMGLAQEVQKAAPMRLGEGSAQARVDAMASTLGKLCHGPRPCTVRLLTANT